MVFMIGGLVSCYDLGLFGHALLFLTTWFVYIHFINIVSFGFSSYYGSFPRVSCFYLSNWVACPHND